MDESNLVQVLHILANADIQFVPMALLSRPYYEAYHDGIRRAYYRRVVDEKGCSEYVKNQLWRHTDGDRVIRYYWGGVLHRFRAPAVIHPRGIKIYYYRGRKHRPEHGRWGGPAYQNGRTKVWVRHGHIHRVDGPAYIVKNRYVKWLRRDMIDSGYRSYQRDEWELTNQESLADCTRHDIMKMIETEELW